MSKLQANEIPSGDINGVNTVFTFLNDIDEMVTLVYDGAEYTNFVINPVNRKQVTLLDAPKYSIYADYYALTSEIVIDSTITFGNIKTRIWTLLGQKSTSTNFNDIIVGEKINNIARKVLKGRVRSLLDANRIYRAGKLWFLEAKSSIRIQGGSILSEPLELGDITMSCTTTNLLPAGVVEIGKDIITYTGTDVNGLIGVSGQTIKHLTSEKITQLYEMPLSMDKPSKVYKIVGENEYEIPLYTGQESIYYEIIRTGTKVFLKIIGLEENDLVSAEFITKYNNMTSNSDINPLPESYGIDVLAYLSAGELAYEKKLLNAGELLNTAYANLQEMYQDYTNEIQIIKQSIKPRNYRFNSVKIR